MAKSIIPHTKWSASKTALLNLLIEHGGQTIAELSSSLGVSVPYTTKTLNELIEDGLIEVTGKKDNYSKRAPKIYNLIATSGYFLGIDTGKQSLTFGICDFCGNMVAEPELIHFDYQDTPECFDRFINLINEYIQRSGIARSQIKKACMSIGGRVNPEIGCAYNYFTCTTMPLAEALHDNATGRSADRKTRPAFLHRQRYPLHDLRRISERCLQGIEKHHLRKRQLGHRHRYHLRRQALSRKIRLLG